MSMIEAKTEENLPSVDFSAEAMATHYDPEAGSYPDEGEPELMEIFLQQTNRSGLFLDIGCGPGFRVRDLDERGRDALGLDISPKMIARAQRENPEIAGKFMVGDMTRLKEYFGKKKKILAGITAFYAAIHVSKDQSLQLFEDCWDLLEDDGYMYIVMQMGTKNEIVSHNPGEKKECH